MRHYNPQSLVLTSSKLHRESKTFLNYLSTESFKNHCSHHVRTTRSIYISNVCFVQFKYWEYLRFFNPGNSIKRSFMNAWRQVGMVFVRLSWKMWQWSPTQNFHVFTLGLMEKLTMKVDLGYTSLRRRSVVLIEFSQKEAAEVSVVILVSYRLTIKIIWSKWSWRSTTESTTLLFFFKNNVGRRMRTRTLMYLFIMLLLVMKHSTWC